MRITVIMFSLQAYLLQHVTNGISKPSTIRFNAMHPHGLCNGFTDG